MQTYRKSRRSQVSKRTEEVYLWKQDPTTRWFFDILERRFLHYGDEWRNAQSLEDLYRLRGKAEVLDFGKSILEDPDSYD